MTNTIIVATNVSLVAQKLGITANITDIFFGQILPYAIVASVISYGIIETVKKLNTKIKEDSKSVAIISLIIVYLMGQVFGLFLSGVTHILHNIVFGVTIGATSVTVYKAAIASVLEMVPVITSKVKKLMGLEEPPADKK